LAEHLARRIGFATDVINAFKALISRLSEMYDVAFLFGLPVDRQGQINAFDIALLWGEATWTEVSADSSVDAETSLALIPFGADGVDFPSWTWVGG
jgi:high-affinity nickel permease